MDAQKLLPYDAVDFTNVKLEDCNMINGVDYYDPDGFLMMIRSMVAMLLGL